MGGLRFPALFSMLRMCGADRRPLLLVWLSNAMWMRNDADVLGAGDGRGSGRCEVHDDDGCDDDEGH